MKEKYIGTRQVRPDALAKVTGAVKFTADLTVHRTDLLYAKALYPPYAHAKILSIDAFMSLFRLSVLSCAFCSLSDI